MSVIPTYFQARAYVSPAEAAEMLGIDRATFYRRVMPFVRNGAIQSLKIGACRRIHVASLLQWAERQGSAW